MIDTAYDYLKSTVLDGVVRPGAFIDMDAAAKHLGISKQPVRFAVSRLQSESLLEVIPQVGCRVPNVTPDQVYDFIFLFAAVEGRMAEFAAQRASAADFRALKRISGQMRALWPRQVATSSSVIAPQFRRLNREFHSAIHTSAKAESARPIAETMMDRYDFYIAGLSETRVYAAHQEHEAVLAAMVRRDHQRARHLMEDHVMNAIERIAAAAGWRVAPDGAIASRSKLSTGGAAR